MNNRRGVSAGGVEDPLAPQPGPSQPTTARHKSAPTSKRKAPEDNETGTSKRTKSSHPVATASKPKTLKGEKNVGGLIINPILPSFNATSDPSSSSTVIIPPRPSSAKGSSKPKRKPPDSLNTTANGTFTSVKGSLAIPKSKGKGKEREVIAPTRQDLEVDEDVRRMEEERERLRIRDAESHSKSEDFRAPLIPAKASVPRRIQTGFASAESPPSSDNLAAIDSTQPIPVRDTPTIERNRAMRGEDVKRRSSMTMRGKRASSSFENTGVIPIPHPTVSTSNFYKHIDHELPQAHQVRHLLVWCAARMSAQPGRSSSSLGTRNPEIPLTAEGVANVQEVRTAMQKKLNEQQIDMSMSSRMDNDVFKPEVKEHEQNAKNRKREDDFMRHIERSKQEDTAWSAAIKSYNARQASVVESLARQRQSAEWMSPDTSDPLHDRELQGAQLARKNIEIASRKRGPSPLTMRMDEIENKVDRAHSALHISTQLTKWATRHLDVVSEGLAGALEARSEPPVRAGEVSTLANLASSKPHPPGMDGLGAPPDTLSILRALTRTDMVRPRGEMGDAARLARREVERNSLATGASERRLTAVAAPTPRKAPGTPRRGGTPRPKGDGPDGSRGDKST